MNKKSHITITAFAVLVLGFAPFVVQAQSLSDFGSSILNTISEALHALTSSAPAPSSPLPATKKAPLTPASSAHPNDTTDTGGNSSQSDQSDSSASSLTVSIGATPSSLPYGFTTTKIDWLVTNSVSGTTCKAATNNFSITPDIIQTSPGIWQGQGAVQGNPQTGTATYSITCSDSAGNSATQSVTVPIATTPPAPNSSPVANDLNNILNLIQGKTPGIATQGILSVELTNPSAWVPGTLTNGQGYWYWSQQSARNPNVFTGSLDLTFLPINYGNSNDYTGNGALIAPDMMIFANHNHPLLGTTVYFEANDGTVLTRTLANGVWVWGAADIYIARLNSPLPSSIAPAHVFAPDDFNNYIAPAVAAGDFIPVIVTNKYNSLGVNLLTSVAVAPDSSPTDGLSVTPNTIVTPWEYGVVVGDSGSSAFMDINNTAVDLGQFFNANASAGGGNAVGGGGGPSDISKAYNSINSEMTYLGSPYQLTPIDLSSFSPSASAVIVKTSVTAQVPILNVSCAPAPLYPALNAPVTWTATASGGTGTYAYSWSGATSGTGASVSASYSSLGLKTADVTVTSGTQSVTQYCGYVQIADNTVITNITNGNPAPLVPTISSITPAHAQAGTTVTISGSNLSQSNNAVMMYSAQGLQNSTTGIASSNNTLSYTIPALSAGTYSIGVTTQGGSSNQASFTIDPAINSGGQAVTPAPAISSVTPDCIAGTTCRTAVYGSYFSATGNDVKVNGQDMGINGGSTGSLPSGSSPSGPYIPFDLAASFTAGTYNVIVTNTNGTSNTGTLTVEPAPAGVTIASVSPSSGPVGTQITLAGSGFIDAEGDTSPDQVQIANDASHSVILHVTPTSNTSLTFTLPNYNYAGSYNYNLQITVTNPDFVRNAAPGVFRVIQTPSNQTSYVNGDLLTAAIWNSIEAYLNWVSR